MTIVLSVVAILLSYLAGSIPFGLLIVKFTTGRDIRFFGSGRIGGTNVMRAAGFLAGFLTALLDVTKGFASRWFVDLLAPTAPPIVHALASAYAIWGSIHSIFLMERDENGKMHLRGGAGGATTVGATMALFFNSWIYLLVVGVLTYIFIGFASVTTISLAMTALVIYGVRFMTHISPWEYVVFGVLALGEVLYALRPNLVRLRQGTERTVGLRAYIHKYRQDHPPKTPR